MPVRTVGVDIQGADEVLKLQKALNKLQDSIEDIESHLTNLVKGKRGGKSSSFSIDVKIKKTSVNTLMRDIRQAIKQVSGEEFNVNIQPIVKSVKGLRDSINKSLNEKPIYINTKVSDRDARKELKPVTVKFQPVIASVRDLRASIHKALNEKAIHINANVVGRTTKVTTKDSSNKGSYKEFSDKVLSVKTEWDRQSFMSTTQKVKAGLYKLNKDNTIKLKADIDFSEALKGENVRKAVSRLSISKYSENLISQLHEGKNPIYLAREFGAFLKNNHKSKEALGYAFQLEHMRKNRFPASEELYAHTFNTQSGNLSFSKDSLRRMKEHVDGVEEFNNATKNAIKLLTDFLGATQSEVREAQKLSEVMVDLGDKSLTAIKKMAGIAKTLTSFSLVKPWEIGFKISRGSLDLLLSTVERIKSTLGSAIRLGRIVTEPAIRALRKLGDLGISVGREFAQNFNNQLHNVGSRLIGIYRNIFQEISILGRQAISSVIKQTEELGDAMETYQAQMSALGQDQSKINSDAKEIAQYGANTVYNGADLLNLTSQYTALDVEDPKALVKAIAGLAATTKNPSDNFKEIGRQLTDSLQKGTLNWADVRIVLARQSALATHLLFKELESNGSLGQYKTVRKAIEKKELTPQEYIDAIIKVGNSDQLQSLVNFIGTPKLAIENLKETIGLLTAGTVGEDGPLKNLYDSVRDFIVGITDLVKLSTPQLKAFGDYSGGVVKSLQNYGSRWRQVYGKRVVDDTQGFLGGVSEGFDENAVFDSLSRITQSYLDFLHTVNAQSLGASLSDIVVEFNDFTASLSRLGAAVINAGGLSILQNFIGIYTDLANVIANSKSLPALGGAFNNLLLQLRKLIQNPALTNLIDTVLTRIINFFDKVITLTGNLLDKLTTQENMDKALKFIDSLFTDITNFYNYWKRQYDRFVSGDPKDSNESKIKGKDVFNSGLKEAFFTDGVPEDTSIFNAFFKPIKDFFKGFDFDLGNLVTDTGDINFYEVGKRVGDILRGVKLIIDETTEWVQGKIANLNGNIDFDTILNISREIFKTISSVTDTMIDVITKSIGNLDKGQLEGGIASIGAIVRDFFTKLGEFSTQILTAILRASTSKEGIEFLNSLKDFMLAVVEAVISLVSSWGGGDLEQGMKNVLKIMDFLTDVATGIAHIVRDHPTLVTTLGTVLLAVGLIGQIIKAGVALKTFLGPVADIVGLGKGAGVADDVAGSGGAILSGSARANNKVGTWFKKPVDWFKSLPSKYSNSKFGQTLFGEALGNFFGKGAQATNWLKNIPSAYSSSKFGSSLFGKGIGKVGGLLGKGVKGFAKGGLTSFIASLLVQPVTEAVAKNVFGASGSQADGWGKTVGGLSNVAGYASLGAAAGSAFLGIGAIPGAIIGGIGGLVAEAGNIGKGISQIFGKGEEDLKVKNQELEARVAKDQEELNKAVIKRIQDTSGVKLNGRNTTTHDTVDEVYKYTGLNIKGKKPSAQGFKHFSATVRNSLISNGAQSGEEVKKALASYGEAVTVPDGVTADHYVQVGDEVVKISEVMEETGAQSLEEVLGYLKWYSELSGQPAKIVAQSYNDQGQVVSTEVANLQLSAPADLAKIQEAVDKYGLARENLINFTEEQINALIAKYKNASGETEKEVADEQHTKNARGTIGNSVKRLNKNLGKLDKNSFTYDATKAAIYLKEINLLKGKINPANKGTKYEELVNNRIKELERQLRSFAEEVKDKARNPLKRFQSQPFNPILQSTGGLVRYFADGGSIPTVNWQSRGTDTVPTMLTPGEYVLRKEAVRSIGLDKLFNMNKYGASALTNNTTSTVVNNYYNNNAQIEQNIDNKSKYLNGMMGLDRLVRYI